MRLKELTAARIRFGYRRLTILLRREGWVVNAKRIYRIYKEEDLTARTKHRKKIARHRPVIVHFASGPNQRWSMDFVAAHLENRSPFRILTVVDQFTRECVVLRAKPSLNGADVSEALDVAIRERGKPFSITVDNGMEFAGKVMEAWSDLHLVHLAFIRPGKPTENAFVESFNGKLWMECLDVEIFRSMSEAQRKLAAWHYDFNHHRPHSAIGDLTPIEFASKHPKAPSPSMHCDRLGPTASRDTAPLTLPPPNRCCSATKAKALLARRRCVRVYSEFTTAPDGQNHWLGRPSEARFLTLGLRHFWGSDQGAHGTPI
jgi:putative transposase